LILHVKVKSLFCHSKELRYIFFGLWNTAFAYALTIVLFHLLKDNIHIVFIGVVSTSISIAQSFLVHKLFVFRTRGEWITELCRSYLVYGVSSVIGITLLWLLVEAISLSIYLAQAIVMLSTVVVSYIGHSKFTFKK
jgi:putative flippase GtrA